jgi:metal transporter CNNM
MKPDRSSFDLMGPTGCLSNLPERFEGEHARRDEKVNGMMAETATEPLHWALAYGSTFVLTCCSAFCSGLTLGLMGLDMTMIEVVKRSGTPADKARAQKIEPIRKTGNQLLCMLLIGNTGVNAGLAITMADLAGGQWGFVVSTGLILIFGEITPQAVCSRYGLAIGAALFWPIQICMWVFYPLAFPISKILNAVLGKEIGLSYSREELIALLAMHSVGGKTAQGPQGDLSDVEAKILTGVLRFTEKTAGDVSTDIKYVQAVGMHEKLDLTVMNCIYRSGHSRIPVYEDEITNLVGILFVKDLIVVDPADGVPVKDVVTYFNHSLPMVSKDLGLLALLDEFIEGHAHMAVVTSASLEAIPNIMPSSPRDNASRMGAHSN